MGALVILLVKCLLHAEEVSVSVNKIGLPGYTERSI